MNIDKLIESLTSEELNDLRTKLVVDNTLNSTTIINNQNIMDLSESAKEARRAYMIAWRNAHPEYVASRKEYNKQWRRNNQEKGQQYSASYWERRASINTQQEGESAS